MHTVIILICYIALSNIAMRLVIKLLEVKNMKEVLKIMLFLVLAAVALIVGALFNANGEQTKKVQVQVERYW